MTITDSTLKKGGRYNWRYQPERLIYMGSKQHNGDRFRIRKYRREKS